MQPSQLDGMIFVTGWRHWVAVGAGVFHEHAGFELVYHPSNSGEVRLESGTAVKFGPGDIVITPPDTSHIQHNNVAGDDICLITDFVGAKAVFPQRAIVIPQVKDEFILRELDYLTSGIVLKRGNGHRIPDYRLRALFASLLLNQTESEKNGDTNVDYVSAACRLMDEAYADVGLEIRMIAGKIGISSDYLRHLFQLRFCLSPKQYLLQRRIERVKELLWHSNLSLKEIAELSGFANERYLCFYFKQTQGTTPGIFRRDIKSNG